MNKREVVLVKNEVVEMDGLGGFLFFLSFEFLSFFYVIFSVLWDIF